ncbi:MAG: SSU ribosomal protein S5e (S7p) [Candidatus Fermentimicrarchaeum limneticum]|jgi:small subunit ribosomal protein S7|uniref:Small ribosomal subunit protein uS7 n=1 Tax=Fermentimicrarchaeum limneticum TaxID=2795018 RepID=A0A7D6BT50_FERL1|nr:MAG: SSU ribosomal protein S5e (S7p) [Candidatus Fermentimicrarchaeum limneticum]
MEKIFDRYDVSEVQVADPSLKKYLDISPVTIPHSHGRHGKKQFEKMRVNIVERLVNKLMRGGTGEKTSGKVIRTHGRLQGKKFKAMKIVEEAFDSIAKSTKANPLQVFVDALQNTAPREDTTRVQYGGVSYQVAVDVSASRRLDMALRNIGLAAIIGAFDKKKTLSQALADEIMLAAKNDPNSYAIKKRDETERMARSAR